LQKGSSTIWRAAAVFAVVAVIAVCFSYDYIYGLLFAQPEFEISAAPNTVTLSYKGTSNRTIVTVRSLNGFAGDVMLEAEPGMGTMGIEFTLNPAVAHVPSNGQVSCVLELVVKSSVPSGLYFVNVVGVAGNLTRVCRILIEVSY
jgi:hypothetical protein